MFQNIFCSCYQELFYKYNFYYYYFWTLENVSRCFQEPSNFCVQRTKYFPVQPYHSVNKYILMILSIFYQNLLSFNQPHSHNGLIDVIAVELRNPKYCFWKDGQKSNTFHKHWKAKEQVGHITTNSDKYQNTQQIIWKMCPIPKVSSLKI